MTRWFEKLLVRRILAGDHQACEQLVREHHAPVYRLLIHLCRDAHVAEDLTQETFAAAWGAIGTFKGSSSIASWLHRIAYRKFIDAHRRTRCGHIRHVEAIRDEVSSNTCTPLEAILAQERSRELYQAIVKLDPMHREVIVLHYFQDLSFREMAEVLDKPVGTVKWLIGQALARLRALLQGRSEDATERAGAKEL